LLRSVDAVRGRTLRDSSSLVSVPIFNMFHPSSNTARTHAHTSISTLKSLVNFCSMDFLFHMKFDDRTLAKRHIVVGHCVRSDNRHVTSLDIQG
jgi:hypothetical protein